MTGTIKLVSKSHLARCFRVPFLHHFSTLVAFCCHAGLACLPGMAFLNSRVRFFLGVKICIIKVMKDVTVLEQHEEASNSGSS